jgi:hypothetical protein
MITLKDNPTQDAQTELNQGRTRVRDDFQKERDTEVAELVKAWETAGKPAPVLNQATGQMDPNPNAPTRRYTVGKDDKNAMKLVIRRAATLAKVGTAWYKDAVNDDGTVTVKFSPAPLPPKAEKNGNAAATPAPTPQAEAQAEAPKPEPPAERRGFRR